MSEKRVLVADDSPLARWAIRTLLKGEPGFRLVGEAENGYQAISLARELEPELILMDISMPRCDGLMATRLIKRELPHATVAMLTVSDEASDLFEAIGNGAQGYLLKSLAPEDWLECLRSLGRGEAVPSGLAQRILAEFSPRPKPPETSLTDRENEVLRLVAGAMTNKQVAEQLYISEQTVKNHIKSLLRKLRLKNRVELALYAKRLAGGPQVAGASGREIAPMGHRTVFSQILS